MNNKFFEYIYEILKYCCSPVLASSCLPSDESGGRKERKADEMKGAVNLPLNLVSALHSDPLSDCAIYHQPSAGPLMESPAGQ